jgi:hypothetical protein
VPPWTLWIKEESINPAGNRNTIPTSPVRSLVTTPNELSRLSKLIMNTIIWKDVIIEVIVKEVTGKNSQNYV